MTKFKEKISERLNPREVPAKRQVMITLTEGLVEQLDLLAKTFTSTSGQTTTRTMLIEDALEAYAAEAFEVLEAQQIDLTSHANTDDTLYDTVVYPAHNEGFANVFLNERKWRYVRIKKERIENIKYLALYRSAPMSQITHYAEVADNGFVFNQAVGKYEILLKGQPIELANPVPLGSISAVATRTPRYTTLEKLLCAQEYKDL